MFQSFIIYAACMLLFIIGLLCIVDISTTNPPLSVVRVDLAPGMTPTKHVFGLIHESTIRYILMYCFARKMLLTVYIEMDGFRVPLHSRELILKNRYKKKKNK